MSTVIEQPRYSCALGAQQTVLAIPRAVPIIHAGPGCSSKLNMFLANSSGFQGEGYAGGSAISATNMTEVEVVFGGDGKLRSTIEGALNVIDADLYVVMTGCTAEIVGDNAEQVAGEFRAQGYPVISAETGGFKGSNYFGHEVVLQSVIKQFIGLVKPDVRKGTVNVFSVVPYQNSYWRGDLTEIKTLLESIGLEVNILFGVTSKGVKEWKNLPNAEFNLVLSPWVGLETAELLKEYYGTPYLHYPVIPVGGQQTSEFLRTIGGYAGLDMQKVNEVIKKEEEIFYDYYIGFGDFLVASRGWVPDEFYLVADANYSVGISGYLVNEFSLAPKKIFITDNTPQQYESKIRELFYGFDEAFRDNIVFDNDAGKIRGIILADDYKKGKTFILGSTWEKQIADELDTCVTNISIPIESNVILNKSYIGYHGGLRLIEDLYSNFINKGDG